MKRCPDYRRELVRAADEAAARIYHEARTGVLFPHTQTVKLLKQAWLAGHEAAKKECKDEHGSDAG